MLGEALSNVARHARATSADVSMVVGEGALTLVVSDNGVGMPEHDGAHSGLDNLAQRAKNLGGDMTVEPSAEGGTRVRWRVPLRLT